MPKIRLQLGNRGGLVDSPFVHHVATHPTSAFGTNDLQRGVEGWIPSAETSPPRGKWLKIKN